MLEIQCYDGDGVRPGAERTVNVEAESCILKPPDSEGCIELFLDFETKDHAESAIDILHEDQNERLNFRITAPAIRVQLNDCYFLGYRGHLPWGVTAKFSNPKNVWTTKLTVY